MEAHANPETGSDCLAIHSRGRRLTFRSDDTGSHDVREMSSTARDDIPSTTDQDVGEYIYVLSILA